MNGRFELANLELRRLLAAWAPLEGGEWVIRGTDRADRLTLEVDPDRTSMAILRNGAKVVQKARLRDLRSIRIDARGGNDNVLVSLPRRTAAIRVNIDGGWGHDTLTGGGADDVLIGGLGNDLLQGRDGADSIDGGHGNDSINGEAGDDILRGRLGSDNVDGGAGRDDIDGGRDDDSLQGAGARDSLRGSDGADDLDGGTGRDVLAGGRGADRIVRQAGRDTVSDSTATVISPGEVARLGQTADDAFVQTLIDRAVSQYRWYFDRPESYATDTGIFASRDLLRSTAFTTDSTNVQVAGVDEADKVETDGRYLYTIDRDELRILDLTDPENMTLRSTTSIGGSTFGIYLLSNARLVVLSQQTETFNADQGDFHYWNYPSMVRVTSYDVSNPDAPVDLGHTDIDGYYSDSRVIGNSVYVVTGQTMNVSPRHTLSNGVYTSESEASFRTRLASDLSWLPTFAATRNGATSATGRLITAENTYLTDNPALGFNFATVAVLDGRNAGNGIADTATIDGSWVSTVYASTSAIYLAGADWTKPVGTSIAKLAITESSVDYVASGAFEGTLVNQFALDEQDGQLRAAVTAGSGMGTANSVLVLEAQGDTLQTIGRADGIAPGERIFSARFVGDRAYVVTFRQVDPFFIVDLSDPTHPAVSGELKIPGVSNYLHPIDDRYVLGIGRDGDDNGILTDVQVSLFDVADPAAPQRVSTLGLPSNTSQALSDHHAVQYFADAGILSLPLGGWSEQEQQLVRVDLDTGELALEGTIPFDSTVHGYGNPRSVKIGDTVFATDGKSIGAYSLDDHETTSSLTYNPNENDFAIICGWNWWNGTTIE